MDSINHKNSRLYTFTNFYLSSIQHGVQTAHVVSELFCKYKLEHNLLNEWANEGKTIIICNGGNNNMLRNLYSDLDYFSAALNLPFTKFHEDDESLDGVLTCVGIIVPEIYWNVEKADARGEIRNFKGTTFGNCSAEAKFISFLKSFQLAR